MTSEWECYLWNAFWMRLENTPSNVLKIDFSFTFFFFVLFFWMQAGFFSSLIFLCVFIHLPNIPAWRSRNDKYIIRNIIYVFYIVNISSHEQTNVIIYLSFISISCIDYSSIHTSYIGNASFCLPDFLSISRDIIDFLHTIDTTECSLCRMRLLTWNHCFLCIVWLHQTLHSVILFIFKRLLTAQTFQQCRIEETHLFYIIQPIHTVTNRTKIQGVQEGGWRLRHMVG